jgi:hypothetical protein
MRNGDAYKITRMAENGATVDEIVERFRLEYSAQEIISFLPKEGTVDAPVEKKVTKKKVSKKKVSKKKVAKKPVQTDIEDDSVGT